MHVLDWRACEILFNAKNCNYGKIVLIENYSVVNFKASKLSQLGHFLFYCPFKGGYFSTVDLEMGVFVRYERGSPRGG